MALGAGWVPEMLRRLDTVAATWGSVDESGKGFTRTPSQQLSEQMGFTPYPIEGGRDPIGRFNRRLWESSEQVQEQFFSENFLRIWPEARVG